MSSVRLTETACTWMMTSPGPGVGVGTSSHLRTSGPPNSLMSMAFTCAPSLEIHITLHPRITGVDLVAVYGISASIAQTILAENGSSIGLTSWQCTLDVHFVNTLPVRGVPGGLCHSRVGENPGGARQGCWMPAYAGMTFSSLCTGV